MELLKAKVTERDIARDGEKREADKQHRKSREFFELWFKGCDENHSCAEKSENTKVNGVLWHNDGGNEGYDSAGSEDNGSAFELMTGKAAAKATEQDKRP